MPEELINAIVEMEEQNALRITEEWLGGKVDLLENPGRLFRGHGDCG